MTKGAQFLTSAGHIASRVPRTNARHNSDVHVFDFDGVLASGLEEAVYRAPSLTAEEDLIAELRARFSIRCESMPHAYQRHLIYQHAKLLLAEQIEHGPALETARLAGRDAPLFILTARSGLAAIRRMHAFLDAHAILPTEVFHVGRVEKTAQLRLIAAEHGASTIKFYEDSEKHIRVAQAADIKTLEPIYFQPDPSLAIRAKAELERIYSIFSGGGVYGGRELGSRANRA